MKKDLIQIAVVGATGNVGRVILNILSDHGFSAQQVQAFSSKKSAGKTVSFGDDATLTVHDLNNADFNTIDVALFSAGSAVSQTYAPKATKAGCIVIDNTSYFRTDPLVPLIIPEVNPEAISFYTQKNIIANPNCALAPIALALKPLHKINPVKRIIASTYQSVSGAGKSAMDELDQQTRSLFTGTPTPAEKFSRPIAHNLIPQIGIFTESGYTDEEMKMRFEIKKILDPKVELSATCVRVPVFIGHCSCVHVEFENVFAPLQAIEILQNSPGIRVIDAEDTMDYATPLDAVGEDDVLVSRLRQDLSLPNGLVFWTASDNLRKGAALNAVQILELLLNNRQWQN